MSIQLRKYQIESVSLLRKGMSKKVLKQVLVLPTGGGKTYTFSDFTRRAILKAKHVFIITHRTELISQAGKSLFNLGVDYHKITNKTKGLLPPSKCYLAMVKTLTSRKSRPDYLSAIKKADLIIVDECHLGDLRPVHALFDGKYIIGVTATPISSSKKHPLNKYFQEIIVPVHTWELIEDGHLVPAITYSEDPDRSGLVVEDGDYSESSQIATLAKVSAGVVPKYKKYAMGRKTICFNVNVEKSKEQCELFRAAGISAEHIDGNTPEDVREQIIKDFAARKFEVLCNVGIATAGFDDPEVSCVIFNRLTKSLPLWLQCCGRGSRTFPGKTDFVILDMGGNWFELGLWEVERDWEFMFHNPKKPVPGGAPPSKWCPGILVTGEECETILSASAKRCRVCGFEFEQKEIRFVEKEFKLIEAPEKPPVRKPRKEDWSGLSVEDLVELVKSGIYKNEWAKYVIFDRWEHEYEAALEIELFAGAMEYVPGWGVERMKQFNGYKARKVND